ncbi:DUF3265 domain-containing protein [Vibrio parahaemolyticus]|nr:DUF3265 domain-containing protein [Vibrio parahaemolyticus]EGQ8852951.1 DUF3265 domain-containing protein [Vibrio parahaemolyticus]EGQ8857599.1 DUF3265 domain-containing protein [Vibrio parahaemolyticus]EGQ8877090.1 DUF3265 domain-containing protein [Vibrio parahaemolyticus]EGQ8996286.1 DUF3265 domain-containing protein [Vibrio parahaemolyticus]
MRNAWHFYNALILVIKVVCGSSVLRCSPLKRALGAVKKFLGLISFYPFGNLLWFLGNLALSSKILESLNP